MSVTKSFTAVSDGPELQVRSGETVTYDLSGTWAGTVLLQQKVGDGVWKPLVSKTANATGAVLVEDKNGKNVRVRLRCDAFTSGTIVSVLDVQTTDTAGRVQDPLGADVLQFTRDGVVVPAGKTLFATSPKLTTPIGAVAAVEASFTETAGAGVYTAAIPVPAGATILDIIVNGVALWTAATSATMKVGDAGNSQGYFTAIDLKATDLLAGESLSFESAGGKAGAYIANSQVSPRYSATARVISGVVTTVGGSGTAGRTRMTVIYHLPVTADIVAATKV